MISIHSQRLALHALPLAEFQLLLTDTRLLAESLGLVPEPLQIERGFWEEGVQDMKNYVLPILADHLEHHEWFTVWAIVLETAQRLVGGIGVAGLPNEAGEVIIGYFVDERYEGQGIATEAAAALTQWVFQHPDAKCIQADTLADGLASQRVLQKCGFTLAGSTEEGNLRWRRWR